MKRLTLIACLLASSALAEPASHSPLPPDAASPAQPPPLIQACAQSATEQMQQAIVWHAQAITDTAEIAALKAQVAKLSPPPITAETKP